MLKKVLILLLVLAVGLVLLLLTARDSRLDTQSSALIGSSPAQVWDLLADIDHWRNWWPGVERSTLLGPLAVGSRIDLKLKGLPESDPAGIDRLVPRRLLGWMSPGVLGSEVTTRLELEPTPEGTEVVLSNSISGPQAVLARFSSGESFPQYQQLVLKALERRMEEAVQVNPGGEKD